MSIFYLDFERFQKGNTLNQIEKKENEYYIAKLPQLQIYPKESTKYSWYKEGTLLKESERIQVAETGDLYFTQVKSQDRGTYKLTAENTFMLSKGYQNARQDIMEFQMTVSGLLYYNITTIPFHSLFHR